MDEEKKLVMAHAASRRSGIWRPPSSARDVEAVLSSDSYPFFLDAMYGDMPNHWSNELSGLARLRFISTLACATASRTASWICIRKAPEDAPAPLKPFASSGQYAYSIALWPLGRHTRRQDSSTSPSASNRQPTKAKPSRPEFEAQLIRAIACLSPRARTAGAESLLCRVAANALPDLHFLAICRPDSAPKDEARDGNMTILRRLVAEFTGKPRSRPRPGFFHCYPSRLTAFEDLKAVAVGVLRVSHETR
jgi:hypothetical protein